MDMKSRNADHLLKCYSFFLFIPTLTMARSSPVLVLSCMLVMCYFSTFQAHTPNQTISRKPNGGFNAIDNCWREDPNWDANRQALADCAKGYGADAQGGKNGAIYIVTDASDDPENPKEGTLRYGAIQTEPLWIIFAQDMSIALNSKELLVNSYKTIDGRGAKVEIANGPCIRIENVNHVIIHGVTFHHCSRGKPGLVRRDPGHLVNSTGNGQADGDAIRVTSSSHVWIDHCHFSNCADGLVDISHASTAVTVSNNYFEQHNKVMLLGHSDKYTQDEKMYVTVAFNHFASRLVQRMPRVRYGYAHVANNEYDQWLLYAVGGSAHPTILSDGNYYSALDDPNTKEVTKRNSDDPGWQNWSWSSEKDLFLNGAYFVKSGDLWTPRYSESEAFEVSPGERVPDLTQDAGLLHCVPHNPC